MSLDPPKPFMIFSFFFLKYWMGIKSFLSNGMWEDYWGAYGKHSPLWLKQMDAGIKPFLSFEGACTCLKLLLTSWELSQTFSKWQRNMERNSIPDDITELLHQFWITYLANLKMDLTYIDNKEGRSTLIVIPSFNLHLYKTHSSFWTTLNSPSSGILF